MAHFKLLAWCHCISSLKYTQLHNHIFCICINGSSTQLLYSLSSWVCGTPKNLKVKIFSAYLCPLRSSHEQVFPLEMSPHSNKVLLTYFKWINQISGSRACRVTGARELRFYDLLEALRDDCRTAGDADRGLPFSNTLSPNIWITSLWLPTPSTHHSWTVGTCAFLQLINWQHYWTKIPLPISWEFAFILSVFEVIWN